MGLIQLPFMALKHLFFKNAESTTKPYAEGAAVPRLWNFDNSPQLTQ